MPCECGCQENPSRGDFLPGHDQRLRADLEARLAQATGRRGLLVIRDLVDSIFAWKEGAIPDAVLLARLRGVI